MTLLNFMNFPNLEQLHHIDCSAIHVSSVASHTSRSGCRVKTLLLQNTRVRCGELLELLRALPTIDTLVMADLIPNAVTDTLLRELLLHQDTPTEGAETVLPTLKNLSISGAYLFSTDMLLNMLESRGGVDGPRSVLSVIDITLSRHCVGLADLMRFASKFLPA